ncbi:MAG: hypothetical protein ABI678_13650 [Kofleriaceae bacterium]
MPRKPPLPAPDPADELIRPLKKSELEFLKGGAQPGPSELPEGDQKPKLARR